jgi:uncharacterized protein
MSLPDFLTITGAGVIIEAFVQPRAARNAIVGVHGTALKFKVAAPPIEDRANRAVEAFVAELLGVSRSDVSVIGGRTSRHKRIRVAGVDAPAVAAALGGSH